VTDGGYGEFDPTAAPPGLLDSVFTWLGQPGYAVKNVLQGDPGAALQNLVQFSSDLTTLGMVTEPLTGYSLNPLRNDTLMGMAGVESGGHGITTREELPTPVDVLKTWGVDTPDPELGWGKTMAINFAGDVLTDPFNLFAGAGTAAKGAVGIGSKMARGAAGAMEVAENLGRAAGQVEKGRGLLASSGLDALLAAKHTRPAQQDVGEVVARLLNQAAGPDVSDAVEEAWLKQLPEFIADKTFDPAIDAAHEAAILRQQQAALNTAGGAMGPPMPASMTPLDSIAARITADPVAEPSAWKSVYRDDYAALRLAERLGVDVNDPTVLLRITGDEAQRGIVESGMQALAREGFMRQPGALYFGLPFQRELVKVMEPESVSKVWEGLKWFSPAGWGWKAVHKLGPTGLATAIEKGADDAWDGLKSIYSRAYAATSKALPDFMPTLVQNWRNKLAGHTYTKVNVAADALQAAGLTAENRDLGTAVVRSLMNYGDEVRANNFGQVGPNKIDMFAANAANMAQYDAGVAQRIAEFTPLFRDQQAAEVYAAGVAKITDEIRAVPELAGRAHHVPAIMDAYTRQVATMVPELEQRGVWGGWWTKEGAAGRLRTNPFYVPNQADEMVSIFLAEHPLPKSKAAGAYAGKLRDLADEAIRDSTVEFTADNFTRARKYDTAELYDKFTKLAQEYNVPVPTLGAATSDVLNTDLLSLLVRRVVAVLARLVGVPLGRNVHVLVVGDQ